MCRIFQTGDVRRVSCQSAGLVMSSLISCLLEFGLESCQRSTNGSARLQGHRGHSAGQSLLCSSITKPGNSFQTQSLNLVRRDRRPPTAEAKNSDSGEEHGVSASAAAEVMRHQSSSAWNGRRNKPQLRVLAWKQSMLCSRRKMFFAAWSIDVLPLPFSRTTLISCGTPNVSLWKATGNQWKRCCVQVQQDHKVQSASESRRVPRWRNWKHHCSFLTGSRGRHRH